MDSETLRESRKQAEIDAGQRPGTTTSDATLVEALEAEVREQKRADEILGPRVGRGAQEVASAAREGVTLARCTVERLMPELG